MMWLNAILIPVLTPFNEFYDGPINRHALTTCRHIMALFEVPFRMSVVGLRLFNKLTRICCDYNDFKDDLFAMK